jgi:hypothetical protein
MSDITGFGTVITLVASITYPVGFTFTSFPDDVDPVDIPSLQIGEGLMGVNGDLITYKKANPIPITIALLPNTVDQEAMNILLLANRPSQGKKYINDDITLVITFPNFKVITLSTGKIIEGVPGASITSVGRIKTFTYKFVFKDITGV